MQAQIEEGSMSSVIKAVGFIIFGSLLTLTCVGTNGSSAPNSVPAIVQAVMPTPAFAQSAGMTIPDIAERTVKGVVNISSEKVFHATEDPQLSPFFSDP